jgi:hypothetical protein
MSIKQNDSSMITNSIGHGGTYTRCFACNSWYKDNGPCKCTSLTVSGGVGIKGSVSVGGNSGDISTQCKVYFGGFVNKQVEDEVPDLICTKCNTIVENNTCKCYLTLMSSLPKQPCTNPKTGDPLVEKLSENVSVLQIGPSNDNKVVTPANLMKYLNKPVSIGSSTSSKTGSLIVGCDGRCDLHSNKKRKIDSLEALYDHEFDRSAVRILKKDLSDNKDQLKKCIDKFLDLPIIRDMNKNTSKLLDFFDEYPDINVIIMIINMDKLIVNADNILFLLKYVSYCKMFVHIDDHYNNINIRILIKEIQ